MDDRAELRAVALERAFAAEDEGEPLATARQAVPLLWLALFDYEDTDVRREQGRDVFVAKVPAPVAAERAKALVKALPPTQKTLVEAALALSSELEALPAELHLVIDPRAVFAGMPSEEARAYLEQLVQLCAVWEGLRRGVAFAEVWRRLARIFPGLDDVLAEQEPRVAGYYLVGSLIEKALSLDRHLVREGQGEKDLQPEALAVGEHGLLLGRFAGAWKLMSSGTREDLRGVWADDSAAFLVGRRGTVLRLRKGRCSPMETPTEAHLHAVWGLNPKFVCAVGEQGTLIAFDGKIWRVWPIPTDVALHSLGGSGPDAIFVAGQESSILGFDGRAWKRMELPAETMVSRICADDGVVYAAGGSSRGGELLRLSSRGVWMREEGLPHLEWVEAIWSGWNAEIGLAPTSGPLLFRAAAGWRSEPIPVDQTVAVASGTTAFAIGEVQKQSVVLARGELGWRVECAVPGLRLFGIWAGGRPKPPRPEEPEHSRPQEAAGDA